MLARPIVWVTVDRKRGIALITGKEHESLVLEVVPMCPFSNVGHGYIMSLAQVADLCCLADIRYAIWRERDGILETPRDRWGRPVVPL